LKERSQGGSEEKEQLDQNCMKGSVERGGRGDRIWSTQGNGPSKRATRQQRGVGDKV